MIDFQRMRWLIRNAPKMAFEIEKAEAQSGVAGVQYSDMPKGSSSGAKLQRDVIRILQVREAYSQVLDELKAMQDELRPCIDKLQNPDQRAVMRLRYLNGHSPYLIAEALHMSHMTVYRALRVAEQKIQKSCY